MTTQQSTVSRNETIAEIVHEIATSMFDEAQEAAHQGGFGAEFHDTTTIGDFAADASALVARIVAAHERDTK